MNGPTGQWILKIILPGLRIQSEILTDPKFAAVRGFIDFLGPDFFNLLVRKFESWI